MTSWGVMGTGRISQDFLGCLATNGSRIRALGARSAARAEEVAAKFPGKIETAVDYDTLFADPEVNIVYIGTIHTEHASGARRALEAGKHCLVEKPISMTGAQAVELQKLAKEKNLFLMEGLWTRTFPLVDKLREVLTSGLLGEIRGVKADLTIPIPETAQRNWDPQQGGGAMLDLGPYPLLWATFAFGTEEPQGFAATAKLSPAGVDASGVLALTYQRGTASLHFAQQSSGPCAVEMMCDKGWVRLEPINCPNRLEIHTGNPMHSNVKTEVHEDPWALCDYPINYEGCQGLIHEVRHVEECLADNLKESPLAPLDDSVQIRRLTDKFLAAVGYAKTTA